MTLATSVAARQGPIAMAGHQICLQVWLAVSLLTDALAASAQVKKFQFLNNILYLFSQIIFICCLSIFPFNFSILNIFFYQKQNIYIYISKVEEMDERPLPQSTKPDQSKTILLHCTRRTTDKSMYKIFQKPKPNFLKRYPPLSNYKSKANQVE